ncbi:TVP38/TMEM64 family inner membrane protein YdjZ [invertebrate metagenome]|uniref:TVP38/TMEM64 family inner membrane protein YdjZ n=1 Tax=invertebrate metagenome TaxID=1711999 RepID=A0A2H9T702_9ZZZZ
MQKKNFPKKTAIVIAALCALLLFYGLDCQQYLSADKFNTLYAEHPFYTALLFFMLYIVVTTLSLPGASLLTLACGFIFGFLSGLLIVSFASTIGATLAFLLSRTLMRSWVQKRFSRYLKTINEGFARDGSLYLLSLRLVPAVPFFAINLIMGVLPMKVTTFYWISQLGMLPATAIFVNAGAQASHIDKLSVSGILSPGLLLSLILLGVFPWIAKKSLAYIKR